MNYTEIKADIVVCGGGLAGSAEAIAAALSLEKRCGGKRA